MSFAIMRTQKLKSMRTIAGAGAHVYRFQNTPNADPAKRGLNRVLVDSGTSLLRSVKNRLDDGLDPEKGKVRGNSVLAVELVLTASPDFFKKSSNSKVDSWIDENQKWLEKKFGKDNVVSLVAHFDETTPHIHAHIVPITKDGRLSAKDYIGGMRHRMSELQTDYFDSMKQFGLKRGEEKSIAFHTDIKSYYSAVTKASKFKKRKIKKPPMLLKRDEYAQSVSNMINMRNKKISSLQTEVHRLNSSTLQKENEKLKKQAQADQDAKSRNDFWMAVAKKEKKEAQEALEEANRRAEKYQEQAEKLKAKVEDLSSENRRMKSKYEPKSGQKLTTKPS